MEFDPDTGILKGKKNIEPITKEDGETLQPYTYEWDKISMIEIIGL